MKATTYLQQLRRISDRPSVLLWVYLLLIGVGELSVALTNVRIGMLAHSILLVGLTVGAAIEQDLAERRFTLALILAPLIRVLSLTLPIDKFPPLAAYPIVAIPLLIGAWMVVRQLKLTRADLRLRVGSVPLQLMFAGGGLGLGLVEYALLQPTPIVTPSWPAFIISALLLMIFTGFTEELIFRGILQALAHPVLGRWSIVYVSSLFAILHVGYLSLPDVVFVFLVGMLFAYVVRWSGSLLGVTLAHGLTNIMLFLVMPYLSRYPSEALTKQIFVAAWIASGIAVLAIFRMALSLKAVMAWAKLRKSEWRAAGKAMQIEDSSGGQPRQEALSLVEQFQTLGTKDLLQQLNDSQQSDGDAASEHEIIHTETPPLLAVQSGSRQPSELQRPRLIASLGTLPDRRRAGRAIYPLPSVIALLILAALHNRQSLSEMYQWSQEHWEDMASQLGFLDSRRGRAPTHPPALATIRGLLKQVNPHSLEDILRAWSGRWSEEWESEWVAKNMRVQHFAQPEQRVLGMICLAAYVLKEHLVLVNSDDSVDLNTVIELL